VRFEPIRVHNAVRKTQPNARGALSLDRRAATEFYDQVLAAQSGSGGRLGQVVEDTAVGMVAGGVVGLVILPAPPDDMKPGPGHDPNRVRVAVPARSGLVVELFGPGAGVAGVGGEVAYRVAELFVG
jgi:hypothetical protein